MRRRRERCGFLGRLERRFCTCGTRPFGVDSSPRLSIIGQATAKRGSTRYREGSAKSHCAERTQAGGSVCTAWTCRRSAARRFRLSACDLDYRLPATLRLRGAIRYGSPCRASRTTCVSSEPPEHQLVPLPSALTT